MEVFIVGHSGFAFTALNVQGSDTIRELKQKLAAISLADSFDYLYVDGQKLGPGETLDSHGVGAETFIFIGFTKHSSFGTTVADDCDIRTNGQLL
jgi:hypothetical protein